MATHTVAAARLWRQSKAKVPIRIASQPEPYSAHAAPAARVPVVEVTVGASVEPMLERVAVDELRVILTLGGSPVLVCLATPLERRLRAARASLDDADILECLTWAFGCVTEAARTGETFGYEVVRLEDVPGLLPMALPAIAGDATLAFLPTGKTVSFLPFYAVGVLECWEDSDTGPPSADELGERSVWVERSGVY